MGSELGDSLHRFTAGFIRGEALSVMLGVLGVADFLRFSDDQGMET